MRLNPKQSLAAHPVVNRCLHSQTVHKFISTKKFIKFVRSPLRNFTVLVERKYTKGQCECDTTLLKHFAASGDNVILVENYISFQ